MLNKVIIMGRLTRDPETRTTSGNKMVTHFGLAVDRDFGEAQTDFFNCTAWNGTATFIDSYFRKGQLVAVSGRLQTNSRDSKTYTEIVVENAYFAERKKDTEAAVEEKVKNLKFEKIDDIDSELPF